MKEKIEQFLKEKEILTEELKEWVKDKSIPLEERWEVFVKSELGERISYYEQFEGVESDGYYDNYYIEKYQTVTTGQLFEIASKPTYTNKEPELNTQEQKDSFREDVLDKFIKSFENDW